MITARAGEIMSYVDVLALGLDSAIRVILWRGHVEVYVQKASRMHWFLSKIQLNDERFVTYLLTSFCLLD